MEPLAILLRNAVPGVRRGLFVGELKRVGKCNPPAFKMTRASRTAPNRLRKGRFVPVGARFRSITLIDCVNEWGRAQGINTPVI